MAEEAMTKEEKRLDPIRINDTENHKEYILDFDRDAVKFCEDRDFDWDYIGSKPATMIPLVWNAAFRRYQQNRVSMADSNRLLEKMGGITPAILARLRGLYDQTLSPLINLDESEESAKNSVVTVEM